MRILIHDFAGHPFQIQLSRKLAHQGHQVVHTFPIGLPGPKGQLDRLASDPDELEIRGIPLSGQFRKYSPVRRLTTQRRYARDLCRLIREQEPDVVLSGNTPIDVQAEMLLYCRRRHIAFVHWIQDIYICALNLVLRPKLGPLAELVTFPFRILETAVARRSDAVVVIASDFTEFLATLGIHRPEIEVIENWAPLDEVPLHSKHNAWSQAAGIASDDLPVLLYSGTLGLKHKPELLYHLAHSLEGRARVVVLTEGLGRQYLESQPKLSNLVLMDFQPYERVPEVLAAADILLATLEPEAAQFAIPSKILSYLCAARPILLAAPARNLSVSILDRSGAGLAVDPGDLAGWTAAAAHLVAEPGLRREMGSRGRSYAELTFNIDRITSRFESVLSQAQAKRQTLAEPVLTESN